MPSMRQRGLLIAAVLWTAVLLSGHPAWAADAVTLELKWFHQFQFAGYYAAKEKGFFAEEGLDVAIRERDPKESPIDRVLEARRRHARVRADGVSLSVEGAVDDDVPLGLLEPVARAALELVTQGDRARLRQCDADDCGLWFYDTSRNGSRRWCSMARCGNRAKVAAHYRRHREG